MNHVEVNQAQAWAGQGGVREMGAQVSITGCKGEQLAGGRRRGGGEGAAPRKSVR